MDIAGCHQVIERTQASIQGDILECARHPHLGDAMGWQPREVLTIEEDLPLIGSIEAVEAIQHGSFTGAVGSDNRQYLTWMDVEADSRERLRAAEAQ